MSFNYKDVLRAPRIGFSAKKIWVGLLGLFCGVTVYSIFSYLAYISCPTWSWVDVWRQFKYIPVPVIGVTNLLWYSWILWGIGIALFTAIQFLAIGAISKLTLEQLKGDEFYEVTDAIKYSFKQWKAIILSPVALIIFVAGLIFTGFLCGLIGRIPYVGQILAGIFFIPVALGAVFAVYLGIILILSFLIGPSIGGATDSDTFDTLFEIFSCLNDQTWRVVLWEAIVGIFAFIGAGILAWFVKQGLLLMHWGCGFWAGTRLIGGTAHSWWDTMWHNGLCYLPPCPPVYWIESVVGRMLPVTAYSISWMPANATEWFGSFCVGISFYFLAFFVMAYGISTWASGQTLIYTVLAKIKDDKNLLEKREEEFEEETIEELKEEKKEEVTEKAKENEQKEENKK